MTDKALATVLGRFYASRHHPARVNFLTEAQAVKEIAAAFAGNPALRAAAEKRMTEISDLERHCSGNLKSRDYVGSVFLEALRRSLSVTV
jgi:hypothetical protein